jgi:uncharacterized membrane protein YobD (UPF0266 family)
MLLFDHLLQEQPSLSQHSLSLLHDEGLTISKQGIDKRFNTKAVTFIKSLLEEYLKSKMPYESIPTAWIECFNAIRIMDSTQFQLPENLKESYPGYGGCGTISCAQIQFEYDIISGNIIELTLDSATVADVTYANKSLTTIKKGELILRDLAYNGLWTLNEIALMGAFYISKIKEHVVLFEEIKGELIELEYKEILRRMKKIKNNNIELNVLVGRTQKLPVRLIATVLEDESTKRREQRKKFKHKTLSENEKARCSMNLIITNVQKEVLPIEEVYPLYQLRWQIEIVFKVWKSIMNIEKIRRMKTERFECYIYSKLIWILISRDIVRQSELKLIGKSKQQLSEYKCFAIIKRYAFEAKEFFLRSREELREWLEIIENYFSKYGSKEKRKYHANSYDLLKIKLC